MGLIWRYLLSLSLCFKGITRWSEKIFTKTEILDCFNDLLTGDSVA